jgi:hypothetical protein
VDAANIIRDYGLDESQPDVKLMLGRKFESEIEVKAAIADLMKPKPVPSSAQTPAKVERPSGTASVAELTDQYKTDMLGARGNKSALKAIKERAKQNGVPVDSVIF